MFEMPDLLAGAFASTDDPKESDLARFDRKGRALEVICCDGGGGGGSATAGVDDMSLSISFGKPRRCCEGGSS